MTRTGFVIEYRRQDEETRHINNYDKLQHAWANLVLLEMQQGPDLEYARLYVECYDDDGNEGELLLDELDTDALRLRRTARRAVEAEFAMRELGDNHAP